MNNPNKPSIQQIALVAYCPLGSPGNAATRAQQGANPPRLVEHPAVRQLAAKRGVSASQVLLLWNLQRGVAAVIPKSTSVAHIRENALPFFVAESTGGDAGSDGDSDGSSSGGGGGGGGGGGEGKKKKRGKKKSKRKHSGPVEGPVLSLEDFKAMEELKKTPVRYVPITDKQLAAVVRYKGEKAGDAEAFWD